MVNILNICYCVFVSLVYCDIIVVLCIVFFFFFSLPYFIGVPHIFLLRSATFNRPHKLLQICALKILYEKAYPLKVIV